MKIVETILQYSALYSFLLMHSRDNFTFLDVALQCKCVQLGISDALQVLASENYPSIGHAEQIHVS